MQIRLAHGVLALLLLSAAACDDDSREPRARQRTNNSDRSRERPSSEADKPTGDDPKPAEDAAAATKLERPGSLPRPPGDRLPADLRPPR